jgi:GTPase SAR1 family protein
MRFLRVVVTGTSSSGVTTFVNFLKTGLYEPVKFIDEDAPNVHLLFMTENDSYMLNVHDLSQYELAHPRTWKEVSIPTAHIFFYDVTQTDDVLSYLKEYTDPDIPTIVVGNKVDATDLSREELEPYLGEYQYCSLLTSVKEDCHITQIFGTLLLQVLSQDHDFKTLQLISRT